jgi:hypothetical protein
MASLIYLPHGEGGAKQGVDDFLASGKSVDDLLSFATPHLKRFEDDEDETGLPQIQINARHLRDITQDALNGLEKANNPPTLFVRGSAPARINSEARVEILSREMLRGILDRTANFVTVKADGVTPSRPPADLAPDIMALPSLPFPKLEGVSTVPLFMPDGSLLYKSGYHPESGLYLHLNGLEDLHTDMPVGEAKKLLLEEVYGDFPFADEAGKAHTLCMLLEPFAQRLVGNVTPLYNVDAPTRGTGKGLHAEVTASIVTGRTAPIMVLPSEGDELEKRVTSALLEGTTFLLLDNVTALRSPVLAAAITSSVWRGRRLGQSQMVEVPNTSTWIATGNNVELSDEIARRIIPIRLDPGIERPENRTGFRHPNLKAFVLANRSKLVSACLSLIQAWVNEGMPEGKEKLGSFEAWCAVMGGILGVSGVSGFLSGRQRLYESADHETTEWGFLCSAWFETFGNRPVAARDIFAVIKERELLLDLWGGRSELSALQRLGNALNAKRDRVFAGYTIRLAGKDSITKSNTYRLEQKTVHQTPVTPLNPVKHVQDDKSPTEFEKANPRDTGETPITVAPNPHDRNAVLDSESSASSGVYGVSGVLNPRSLGKVVIDL